MTKEEEGERFSGKVIEVLRGVEYRIQLENGRIILAHSSGKIRKNKIKILLEDGVVVIMNLNYDMNRGIIVERNNPGDIRRRGFHRGFKRNNRR